VTSVDQKSSRLNEFLESPEKGLWKLAWPVMAGMGIQTLYTIVDMIFIGRLGGEAIAAIAFNMPLFFFVLGLTMGLGAGVTASIARFIGAKDKVNADNSAEHAVVMGVGISIILTIIVTIYGRDILLGIGAPESVIDLSWSYLRVICIGLPFMVLSAFFRSILVGEGDTKFPMTVAALGTVLNIILDPIFIFTLGLGVAGAAWATAISQITVFTIFIYMLFFKEHSYITFRLKDFSPSSYITKDIIKVGLPASMSMIIMSFGQLVFNRILIHFSTDAVAAYQIGGRIDMVIFLPILSISYTLTTLVGMFFGSARMDKVKHIIYYGLSRSFMIAVVTSALVYFTAPKLVLLFTDIYSIYPGNSSYLFKAHGFCVSLCRNCTALWPYPARIWFRNAIISNYIDPCFVDIITLGNLFYLCTGPPFGMDLVFNDDFNSSRFRGCCWLGYVGIKKIFSSTNRSSTCKNST